MCAKEIDALLTSINLLVRQRRDGVRASESLGCRACADLCGCGGETLVELTSFKVALAPIGHC
jgi:hypothetical protein